MGYSPWGCKESYMSETTWDVCTRECFWVGPYQESKDRARARVEPPQVQILVVVANIQTRTLSLQPGRPPRRPPVLCPRQLPLTLFLGVLPSHPHGTAWWLSLVWSRT